MKIDLLGGIVKVDEGTFDAIRIKNGTILVANSDVAIDVSKLSSNVKIELINNHFILVKNMSKWKYIKMCLLLAWRRLVE